MDKRKRTAKPVNIGVVLHDRVSSVCKKAGYTMQSLAENALIAYLDINHEQIKKDIEKRKSLRG